MVAVAAACVTTRIYLSHMIVMKFGGTSVEDASAMRTVERIVRRELHRAPLVVLSACAGVTNSLVRIAHAIVHGRNDDAGKEVALLIERHRRIWDDLQLGRRHEEFERLLADLDRVSQLMLYPPDELGQLTDQLTSYGERLSSFLLTTYMQQQGLDARLLDAAQMMITDDQFTMAVPQMHLVEARSKELCAPLLAPGRVIVTQGFIGSTLDGAPTTIGRGGSDYSAALFGSVLDAEEIQIWTDVDGILTADPTLVRDARRIRYLTFREAAELAYFGARVLHPKTILPAIEKGIPVRVLNSKRPEVDGTLIAKENIQFEQCIVKSVAYKTRITVVNIESTRMLMAHGFLARLFEVFARFKKAVDVIATSEIGVSLTVDDPKNLDSIATALREFADVEVLPGRAVLCVVGENMKFTRGIAAKVFTALDHAGVNVELISHGGSEINLTMVIREEEIPRAVQALHEELFARVDVASGVFE